MIFHDHPGFLAQSPGGSVVRKCNKLSVAHTLGIAHSPQRWVEKRGMNCFKTSILLANISGHMVDSSAQATDLLI